MRSRSLQTFGIFVMLLPLQAAGAAGSSCDGKIRSIGVGWSVVDAPDFGTSIVPDPLDEGGIDQIVVDPKDPSRIYATDDQSLQRTTDGGCSWEEVYKVGTALHSPTDVSGATEIRSLELGPKQRLYIALAHPTGAISVATSKDGGESWADASLGLPPSGGIYYDSLAVSQSDGDVAYLGVQSSGVGSNETSINVDTVFGTGNGGALWEPRTSVQSRLANSLQKGDIQLKVDPADSALVWSFAQNAPTRLSEDGGATWTTNRSAQTAISDGFVDIDLMKRSTGPSLVVGTPSLTAGEEHFVLRSDDYGLSFYKVPTPEPAWTTALGVKPGQMAVITGNSSGVSTLWKLDSRVNKWVDITPPGTDGLYDIMTATKGKKTRLVAHDDTHIYTYTKGI